MRSVLITLFSIFTLNINSQTYLYDTFEICDKFDDVIEYKNIKTLITKNDSTITIETKGRLPVKYNIYKQYSYYIGSKDSITNLVNNIYGFENAYKIFQTDSVNRAVEKVLKEVPNADPKLVESTHIHNIANTAPVIVFRIISSYRFTYSYENDLVWIKFWDGSRIIYSNNKY